jgi:YggT family protein
MNILWYLIETIGSILGTAFVLRAYGQWVMLHPRDQVMTFVVAITDWLVKPLRKLLPASKGRHTLDVASLLGALIVAIALAALFFVLAGAARTGMMLNPGLIVLQGFVWLLKWSLYLLMFLVFMQAILSWVNPNAPIAPALVLLTKPFLTPIRKIVPLIGNVDLSPLALIIILQVVMEILRSVLPAFIRF